MNYLDELAIRYDTDKSSKGHNYTETYFKLFEDKRNEYGAIMEAGIWHGASLKMWKDYFSKSLIFGFDNCDHIPWEEIKLLEDDRIKVFKGDQLDTKFLINTFSDIAYDMILDDAGHGSAGQQVLFRTMFPYLKSGGYYIIEDLALSIQYRELEDLRSCTINFLESWKEGKFFSYYMSPIECFKYGQAIESIEIIGELGIIKKK
jgi:hypothetical protein